MCFGKIGLLWIFCINILISLFRYILCAVLIYSLRCSNFCVFTDDALNHLLHACDSPYAVFDPPRETRSPHYVGDDLIVEGHRILSVPEDRTEKIILWGLSFTVFGQVYAKRHIRVLGHVMCTNVLKTDPVHPTPCGWKAVSRLL